MYSKDFCLTTEKKSKKGNYRSTKDIKNRKATQLPILQTQQAKSKNNINTFSQDIVTTPNVENNHNNSTILLNNEISMSENEMAHNLFLSDNINNLTNNDNFISAVLKEIPLNNLNDYYDIESNIFNKRIQKLNLKFFWTSESLLTQNEIQFPYNKLFLILFKEISLYIEEITRLNKQLKQKTKNERYYQDALSKYKEKEKDYLLNKQTIKSLQRENLLLEKLNEKYKNAIEKLNKKLATNKSYIPTSTNSVNKMRNMNIFKSANNIKSSNTKRIDQKRGTYSPFAGSKYSYISDAVNAQGSIMSFDSNKNIKVRKQGHTPLRGNNLSNDGSKILKKNTKKKFGGDNSIEMFNEILNEGIIRCDEEINNLNKIERLLYKIKN